MAQRRHGQRRGDGGRHGGGGHPGEAAARRGRRRSRSRGPRPSRTRPRARDARPRCHARAAAGPCAGTRAAPARHARATRSPAARRSPAPGCTTATIVSVTSSPGNARWPVSISYSTAPNAQMSARRSTGRPLRLLRTHVRRRAENHPHLGHRLPAVAVAKVGEVVVGEAARRGLPAEAARAGPGLWPTRSRAPSRCRRRAP